MLGEPHRLYVVLGHHETSRCTISQRPASTVAFDAERAFMAERAVRLVLRDRIAVVPAFERCGVCHRLEVELGRMTRQALFCGYQALRLVHETMAAVAIRHRIAFDPELRVGKDRMARLAAVIA